MLPEEIMFLLEPKVDTQINTRIKAHMLVIEADMN